MDKKFNLSQLADLLAQAGGMTKSASEQFVKNFFDIISQNVIADGMVKVKGLGTFKLLQMEDRESVNVNTGERFTIEGHQKITFTPDADLKERINKPFAAFETTEITAEQAAELTRMDQDKSDESAQKAPEKAPETVAEKAPEKETGKTVVTEVKEKRHGCLRVLIWLLSILLILALIIFLLWPVIGGRVLDVIDCMNSKNAVRENAPVPAVVAPPKTEEPAATTTTTTTTTTTEPKTTPQPAKEEVKFSLTKADQEKDLPLFTAADTVNYRITGTKAVHTMTRGDMLTTISLRYYGTKKLWPYIAKYNGLSSRSSERLPVGYRIKVPELANK